jgi:Protein of unknown function (DUF1217)
MKITPAIAATLFSTNSSSSFVAAMTGGGASATGYADPIATLRDAEKNSAKQIVAKAKEPMVKRDLDAFEKAVKGAKSVDDLLKNDAAMRVFLTANDLGDLAQYKGLISKTLKSDYLDENSVAAKVGAQRGALYSTTLKYDFHYSGLEVIQKADSIKEIKDAYVEVLWRQSLDAKAPGVSNALAFKEKAASLNTAYKILGDPVGREVVTTALGLPPQIAYQPVQSQASLIERRLDITKLKNPAFADMMAKRYLVALNGGGTSLTA